jgi:RNA polymerase sigma-70 factor (ECF subfamily)
MGTLADDLRLCMRSPKDNSAWERLIGGHKRLLTGIVYRVARRFGVGSLDDVEDAVQEICLKICSHIAAGKIPNCHDTFFETYIKALVANAAHDYFRARRAKKRDMLASEAVDSDLIAEGPEAGGIETHVLLKELESLAGQDARSRQVFQLYYRLGWTAKEIAAIPNLGLSDKGVESLLFRITSELREKVKTGGQDSSGKKETSPRPT